MPKIFEAMKLLFSRTAIVAMSILMFTSGRPAIAGYVEDVLALEPIAYFRLDEEPGALDAESLGSSFEAIGQYHEDARLGVPGLIASDPENTAVRMPGGSGVDVPNFQGLNVGGPWEEKSVVLWFQADDVGTVDEQVLWEQGGALRGVNLYLREDEVYVGAWDFVNDDGGVSSPWISGDDDPGGGGLYLHTPVASDEIYQVALVMDGDSDGLEGTLAGYLNGQPFGEKAGVGRLFDHPAGAGIGHVHGLTFFQDGKWNIDHGMHFTGVIDEVALFNTALSAEDVLALYEMGSAVGGAPLRAGDADRDYEFTQLDLVQVQIAAKYLTGQPATWGEGDWDGAPGGSQGKPPIGDGLFNQLDIVAALAPGHYLTGPYASLRLHGRQGDGQTSIVYNANTGELAVDAPAGMGLTSINIDSALGIFTGDSARNLGGSFENHADANIFKAAFGSSFGSSSFGNVAQPGLTEEFLLGDVAIIGSLAGKGHLGNVDLIYVPEPSTALLALVGALARFALLRQRRYHGTPEPKITGPRHSLRGPNKT